MITVIDLFKTKYKAEKLKPKNTYKLEVVDFIKNYSVKKVK